ncbi:MAG: hypothetical protein H6600_07570 [Flavobacteriales bacterium]|nr:hypothetical protein [Flavobacteriales bacterium]MCB9198301.1 hypothetical protein [Flavobacteriales bacterium]
MKQILSLFLVLGSLSAFACDNCNVYLNMNPNDLSHNFGIRLRTRYHEGTFDSSGGLMLKHGGELPQYHDNTVRETYQRIELAGTYFWNLKWNTQIIVPIVQNTQEVDNSLEYFVRGIGDVTILQNYMLFNTKNYSDSIKFKHRLSVGAGLKFPTGSIDVVRSKGIPNIDLQPGTGSWDVLFSTTYIGMYEKVGLMANANYKLNGTNKDHFQYGNTLNINSYFFGMINISKLKLMPMVGVYSEIFAKDKVAGEVDLDTGGDLWMWDGGLSLFVSKLKLQFNYQKSIQNHLVNKQQLPTKWRYNIGLYYSI